MPNQYLLAFGVILLVCGVSAYINPSYFRKVIGSYAHTPAILYTGGIINLVLGLFLVINFSAWITIPEAIIAFIGVLAVLKGFLMIMFPKYTIVMSERFYKDKGLLKGEALAMIFFGVILSVASFM